MNAKGKKKVGASPLYPWKRWMQIGRKNVLVKGKHFDCQVHSFVTYLYIRSRQLGFRISVSCQDNSVTFKVLEKT